jgi:hypothetical protein
MPLTTNAILNTLLAESLTGGCSTPPLRKFKNLSFALKDFCFHFLYLAFALPYLPFGLMYLSSVPKNTPFKLVYLPSGGVNSSLGVLNSSSAFMFLPSNVMYLPFRCVNLLLKLVNTPFGVNNTFFFLDEKETKSQDKTICHAQAKLLRVLSGLRAVPNEPCTKLIIIK